uniref:NADH dehydrogenase subunit 2 n=1 Tax=Sancassania mycophaga TaxID=3127633 RepID=UPI00315DD99B
MSIILVTTTLLGVCSTSWIMIWVCLEMNTLAMCWIIAKDMKIEKMQEYTTLLYYLVQVMASIILLLTTNMEVSLATCMIMSATLMMKMGVWPIHSWYMKLIKSMEMKQASMLIVMTWQKILPVMLLMSMAKTPEMKTVMLVMALITLVAPLSKLVKNLSMKSIMALSSFNNNGWLMISTVASMQTFLAFLTLYSSSLLITLKSMKFMSTKSMSVALPFWSATLLVSNMGGLPPLTMFWSKILVVKSMMSSTIPTELAFVLMITACYFLYHYLWMVMNEMSWSPMKTQNVVTKEKESNIIMMISMTSILGFMLLLT